MRKLYITITIVVVLLASSIFFGTKHVLAQEQPATVVYSMIEVNEENIYHAEMLKSSTKLLPNGASVLTAVGTGAVLTFSLVAGIVMRKKMLQF